MALRPITVDTAQRFCALVVGQAGLGKTSLLRTILGQEWTADGWRQVEETSEKVCTLSAEAGLLCVRDLVSAGKIEGYEIGSFADFREAQQMLLKPEMKQRYDWVFIDSLTEISSRCVEAMKAKYPSKSDSFPMWGEYNDLMTQMIKAFRDLSDYNVVFTCLESVDTDQDKRRFIAPAISGSALKERLVSYFDEVLHLTEMQTEDGAVCRVFRTRHPIGLAKDRSGRLADVEKPSLRSICKKIMA